MTNTIDQNWLYTDVGKRIRVLRSERGFTQAELAEQLGLTRTSVTNIEKGRQKLLVHTLLEFASVLQVAPVELLPELPAPQSAKDENLIDEKLLKEYAEADQRFVLALVAEGTEEE